MSYDVTAGSVNRNRKVTASANCLQVCISREQRLHTVGVECGVTSYHPFARRARHVPLHVRSVLVATPVSKCARPSPGAIDALRDERVFNLEYLGKVLCQRAEKLLTSCGSGPLKDGSEALVGGNAELLGGHPGHSCC